MTGVVNKAEEGGRAWRGGKRQKDRDCLFSVFAESLPQRKRGAWRTVSLSNDLLCNCCLLYLLPSVHPNAPSLPPSLQM